MVLDYVFFVSDHGMLKYISLVLLTLQNAVLILVMRYTRTSASKDDMYMATTAVIMSELFKVLASLSILFLQEGKSIPRLLAHLHQNIIKEPLDCLKISVPSIIYTLQNNLLYVALTNLEAATFQVTYQLKILTTALFSVIMLKKQLSRLQWVALFLLFAGVSIVQLQTTSSSASTKDDKAAMDQRPLLGLVAVVVSCLMSGFAGVYFEKILKGTKPSIWLRNVQLGSIGVVIGFITMELNDGSQVHTKGFFHGYNWTVWCVVMLQSFGGLMVAVVVKYADNILKGFATSAAIILSMIASVYFFDFHLSIQFMCGATLVMLAVYMYSRYVPVTSSLPTSHVNRGTQENI